MSITIAVASDLHTEIHPTSPDYQVCTNSENADLMILAGDIGNPHKKYGALELILAQIQKNYPITIYVPGNHEYNSDDSNTCLETVNVLRRLVNRLNLSHRNQIYLLSRESLELQFQDYKICIIGATLWTQIENCQTPKRDAFLSCQQRNLFYRLDKEYIENILSNISNHSYDSIITVTHHPPVENFSYGDAANYYGSKNEKLCDLVDYWICGHVHEICTFEPDYQYNNYDHDYLSKIIINPIGRFSEHLDRKVEFFEIIL